MIKVEDNLVVQDGRILGRLERWDNPIVLQARRCHGCGQLVPVPNWDHHQLACNTIGWGHYKCPIASFTAPAGKLRAPQVDWVAELARLLK